MTCETLARLIRADTVLVADVIAAVRAELEAAGQADPAHVTELQRRKEKLSIQIKFLLENAGESDEDRREASHELRRLRADRATIEADLHTATRPSKALAVPSEADVKSMLDDLAGVLAAAIDGEPEDAGAARQIVESLTGGRIGLEQQGERKQGRGWVRGRFRLQLLKYVCERFGTAAAAGDGVEVVIDFRDPSLPAQRADCVGALYEEGWRIDAIGEQLGLNVNSVRLALVEWFKRRGLPVPDNRSRRNARPAPNGWRPQYQIIAPEVRRLLDEGLTLQEIADTLNCSKGIVKAAKKYGGGETPDRRRTVGGRNTRSSPRR